MVRRQPVPLQVAQANRLIADVYRMQAKYDQALAHLQAARAALDTEALEEQVIPGQDRGCTMVRWTQLYQWRQCFDT